jgi:RNA polymerase sigma-70 factor (ECF subfamily)
MKPAVRHHDPSHAKRSRVDRDTALLARIHGGDRKALRALFDQYGNALVNFAYRFLGSRTGAEEIAELAFLELFRARGRHGAEARASTLIYGIATRLCLGYATNGQSRGDDPPAGWLDGGGAVRKAIASLPPNQRMALLLSRVDGFSPQDVADCLDLPHDATKSLIFRATLTLRECLRRAAARPRTESRPLDSSPRVDRTIDPASPSGLFS